MAPSLASKTTRKGSKSPTWSGFSNTMKALTPHIKSFSPHWITPEMILKRKHKFFYPYLKQIPTHKQHQESEHVALKLYQGLDNLGESLLIYGGQMSRKYEGVRVEKTGVPREGHHLDRVECFYPLAPPRSVYTMS